MGKLQKIGKFYTKIIMSHIGIFIFVGILFVVFHSHGWFPNEDMYAISQLVYSVIIPTMVAYESGKALGGNSGGVLAVLAISGVLTSHLQMGLLAAMLVGPFCGFLWKKTTQLLEKHMLSSLQMLVRNLCLGLMGAVFALTGYYVFLPALEAVTSIIYVGINFMAVHKMTGLLSIIIEPAKIFFLNNIMNHTILVPLGMSQIQGGGSSIFFLLESNPGPGIGMLLALYIMERERRKEYATAMFAHGIGGIHEVYFPFALSNLRLLIPLILGGMAGSYTFEFLQAGLRGVVSPGSIIIVLLMAGKDTWIPVMLGMTVSALVSFGGCMAVLRWQEKGREGKKEGKKEVTEELVNMKIEKIGFVCDAGVGSSAMGAALLRRMFHQEGREEIQVAAYSSDMIPKDLSLIVCQKDFESRLPKEVENIQVVTVDNLVSTAEFTRILELIQNRNR